MPSSRISARTPDTLCLLVALLIVGVEAGLTGGIPPAVARILPVWGGLAWTWALAASAAVSLAGLLWRDPITGWSMEMIGRFSLACICAGYAIAVLEAVSEWQILVVVALTLAIAVSSIWRVVQIYRRLDDIYTSLHGQKLVPTIWHNAKAAFKRSGGAS